MSLSALHRNAPAAHVPSGMIHPQSARIDQVHVPAKHELLHLCTGLSGAGAAVAGEQAERAFERLTQCALAALQHNPEGFEPWLPPWLRVVLDAALLGVDAPAVRAGRAKRRVALVRRSR